MKHMVKGEVEEGQGGSGEGNAEWDEDYLRRGGQREGGGRGGEEWRRESRVRMGRKTLRGRRIIRKRRERRGSIVYLKMRP